MSNLGRERVVLVWAQTRDGVIGDAGDMPWHVPEDLAHFAAVTMGHPVIMGRRTWASFPAKFRPLPGRTNIVLSRDASFEAEGAHVVQSLEAGLDIARRLDDTICIIGGGHVYREAMPIADVIEVTDLDLDTAGDTHAPDVGEGWAAVARDPARGWHTSRTGVRYAFRTLERVGA